MKLCDLHTHVLPGVDDGAENLDCALQMLRNAAASDVALLAVTPHCGGIYGNVLDEALLSKFLQLKHAAREIPVELVLGGEARVDDQFLPLLAQKKLPTIGGSRYLLTEFAPDEREFTTYLEAILEQGCIPLIAHPERYIAVCKNPQVVLPWLDMGCHLQLTGGSILGEHGTTVQRTSAFLLQNDLVACIASDAHGLHRRSNFLMNVYDHLSVQYSKHYAACLMHHNPLAICRDEEL